MAAKQHKTKNGRELDVINVPKSGTIIIAQTTDY